MGSSRIIKGAFLYNALTKIMMDFTAKGKYDDEEVDGQKH